MLQIVLHIVDLESAQMPLFNVGIAGIVLSVIFGILLATAVLMRKTLKLALLTSDNIS